MTKTDTLTIAFVGCGAIARTHLQGLQAYAPRLRVTATVDTNPGRAAEIAAQTGAQVFTSLADALDQGNFDAVDLMLPHDIHVQAAEMAFAAGKHVLLEKPMGRTVAECEQILEAARRAGTVFMVAEHTQYWPQAIRVQALLREGALGEIITARATQRERIRRGITPRPWRYDKTVMGGGTIIDGGLHRIRPLRMWLGEAEEAIAALGYPFEEMEGESLAQSLIRFRSGTVAAFESTMTEAGGYPGERYSLTGTDGTIVIEEGSRRSALLYNQAHPQGHEILPDAPPWRAAYGLELADFACAVLDGTALAAGPEESVADLRVALAIYRSAESRRWEKV